MSKDGPPPSRLSERMAERVESERRMIEAHQAEIASMLASDRARLAESLKADYLSARSAMQSSTADATAEMQGFVSTVSRQIAQLKTVIATVLNENRASYRTTLERENQASSAAYRALLKGSRPVAVLSAAILLSAASVLAGMTWWSGRTLTETQDQIAIERKALSDIRQLTGRVEILNDPSGTFVILPMNTDTTKIYGCDGRPCLKLPGR